MVYSNFATSTQPLHTLRRKYASKSSDANRAKLTIAETNFQSSVKSAKVEYENILINKLISNKSNCIYKFIPSLSKHHLLPATMLCNDVPLISDFDKAQSFNQYFYSIFTCAFAVSLISSRNNLVGTLDTIDILSCDVYNVFGLLDPTKAQGIDCIDLRVLKNCAPVLCDLLCHLFT